jgi:hypothetical protein
MFKQQLSLLVDRLSESPLNIVLNKAGQNLFTWNRIIREELDF